MLIKSPYTLLVESKARMEGAANVPSDFYLDRYILTFKCDCGKVRTETH